MGLPTCNPSRRRGLTMVDVSITVLIVGILVAVSSPQYVDAMYAARVAAAAERVRLDLTLARQVSMSRSQLHTIEFDSAGDQYHLHDVADLTTPDDEYSVDLTETPYSAEIVSASFGGNDYVSFDHFGQPTSGGVVIVAAGGQQQTITLHASTGRATIP